jgi:Asp-tRNA(Asn)/Glu-tRNA(Gln) amidotransferase B subunit
MVRPLLNEKKKKTPKVSEYNFMEVFEERAPEGHKALVRALAKKRYSVSAQELQTLIFIKMHCRYSVAANDFIEKTKTLSQWVVYYVNSGLNDHLSYISKAINRKISLCDFEAFINSGRRISGLQVEECFDAVSPSDQKETALRFIEKHIQNEDKEKVRKVLESWFLEDLSQAEITLKHGVKGNTIGSNVSRFKKSISNLAKAINLKESVVSNDNAELLYEQATIAVKDAKN